MDAVNVVKELRNFCRILDVEDEFYPAKIAKNPRAKKLKDWRKAQHSHSYRLSEKDQLRRYKLLRQELAFK